VSVVVPTRGRPRALARCLAALRAQSLDCELIVVDDAERPDAETRRVALEAGARLVHTGGAGPAAARNAGARASRGRVVCFTDDDCLPDPRWAELLAASCPAHGAVAGETVNARPADRWAEASQLLTSELQRGSLDPASGTLGFAPTCNLAVSVELARELPFDESFPSAAGEDREWCARLRERGLELRYQPAAVVRHEQSLGGARDFLCQQYRYGRGAARLRAGGRDLAGARTRAALMRAGLRAGPRVAWRAALAQLAVAAGYLAGRLGQ
jgi:glycosyltransferase involved in cell wall biosynthesis